MPSGISTSLTGTAGHKRGPLFRLEQGTPLTRPRFVEELRWNLKATGTNPGSYSGHSFRSEAATAAAAQGISDAHIKQLGRWKNSAYQRYIKTSGPDLVSLATRLSKNSTKS